MTFDDFKADAKALTKDGTYGYGTQAFDFIAGPVALGADYFNADNEFDLTNAGFVDAFSKYADLTSRTNSRPSLLPPPTPPPQAAASPPAMSPCILTAHGR